jgi:hypothetical protein
MENDPDWGARYLAATQSTGRADVIDGATTILGALLKVAIVVAAVKFLFFT